MKKALLLCLVLIVSSTAVFASGSQDEETERVHPREQRQEEMEEITVTGPLNLEDSRMAVIENGGKTYMLMYPRQAATDLELEEGQTVTIEGFVMTGPRVSKDEDLVHVRVTKAVIDGEEYDVEALMDDMGRGRMPQKGGTPPAKRR